MIYPCLMCYAISIDPFFCEAEVGDKETGEVYELYAGFCSADCVRQAYEILPYSDRAWASILETSFPEILRKKPFKIKVDFTPMDGMDRDGL